jgi:hypothetical protein
MQTTTRSGWSGAGFGKPEVRAYAGRRRATRASDVIALTDMTGDRSPLHYDGGGPHRIRGRRSKIASRSLSGRIVVCHEELVGSVRPLHLRSVACMWLIGQRVLDSLAASLQELIAASILRSISRC